MNRRHFLKSCSALSASSSLPSIVWANTRNSPFALRAVPGDAQLVGPDFSATKVWTFNNQIPGVPLRVVRGDPLAVTLTNNLEVPTSVHWHGIRLPNAMDGVAGLCLGA